MSSKFSAPDKILVRGARVHNLKNVSVDIPLGEIVGMAGVSGSGSPAEVKRCEESLTAKYI